MKIVVVHRRRQMTDLFAPSTQFLHVAHFTSHFSPSHHGIQENSHQWNRSDPFRLASGKQRCHRSNICFDQYAPIVSSSGSFRILINLSIAFRSPHPDTNPVFDESFDWRRPEHLIYSRYSQNVSTRAEHVLSKINVRKASCLASLITS